MKAVWLPTTTCLRSAIQLRPACSIRRTLSPAFLTADTPLASHAMPKQFSTSSRKPASMAAPEINFEQKEKQEDEDKLFYARIVPTSRSYFSGQPLYIDDLLSLQALLGKYSSLPVCEPGKAEPVAWRPFLEYKNMVGEVVTTTKYSRILRILQRLAKIHPAVMPKEVRTVIAEYRRDIDPSKRIAKISPPDTMGRTLGAGRRKSSTARAWLVEGTGEVLINGKTLAEAFGRIHDRESSIWALKSTDRVDKYNVWAVVSGGGTTGQAEALALAIGKALLGHEPALKPALRKAGCITRDPRRVERKKPGHVKARKMPAWVKR